MPQERTSSRSRGSVMRPKTLPRNVFHERRVVDDQPVPQPCELALERSATDITLPLSPARASEVWFTSNECPYPHGVCRITIRIQPIRVTSR